MQYYIQYSRDNISYVKMQTEIHRSLQNGIFKGTHSVGNGWPILNVVFPQIDLLSLANRLESKIYITIHI